MKSGASIAFLPRKSMGCPVEIKENERKTRQKQLLRHLLRGGCVAGGDEATEDAVGAD